RVRVVRWYAELQRTAHPEDVGEENGIPQPPLHVVFVLPLDNAALDNAVLEGIEANHQVCPVVALEVRRLASENLLEVPASIPVQVLHMGGVQGVLLAFH